MCKSYTFNNSFKEYDIHPDHNLEVLVNGKNVGIAWKKPFKLDITEGVKKGANTLEIKVTNTWVNRLIGDAQPDVKNKITFTTMPFYQANSPLLPSRLPTPSHRDSLGAILNIFKRLEYEYKHSSADSLDLICSYLLTLFFEVNRFADKVDKKSVSK